MMSFWKNTETIVFLFIYDVTSVARMFLLDLTLKH